MGLSFHQSSIQDFNSIKRLWNIYSLLLIFIVITSIGAFHGGLEWDEGSFFQNAEYFSGDGSNFEESRPAALSYLVSLVWNFTGESTIAGRMAVVLFGIATIAIFHKLVSHEFDDPMPVTAVFALSPLMLYWSFHLYTDVPGLLFVIGSCYAYRRGKPLAAGVLISIATTFRYVFFVFALGIGLAYLIDNRDRFEALLQTISRYTVGGFLGASPFFLYSYLEYGKPWSKISMYISRVSRWSDSGVFAATVPSIGSGLYMLSSLIPGAYMGWSKTPTVEKSMVLSYAVFILFIAGNTFHRYWLAVLPFLCLMSYRGLDRRMFAVVSVIMILISAHGVAQGYSSQYCEEPFEQSLDYVSDLEGDVVSDNWAIAGYWLDREVHSPWTDYNTLREKHDARYAVVANDIPYEMAETFSNDCRTYRVYDLTRPIG